MKTAIFSFVTVSDKSMVASVKVARFVRDTLRVLLVDDERIAEHDDLDALLIVNGAYAFCKHLEPLSRAILGARRIIWIQQDYSIVPPICDGQATSPFRRAFVERREKGRSHLEYWTTCEKESKATTLSRYLNWNCLTFSAVQHRLSDDARDLFYYGSFRAGRAKAFDRFFLNSQVDVTISSPTSRFQQRYDKARHLGKIDDLSLELSRHGLGLYLEDRLSHSNFHSPPNRFYEMLSAGLPMVFQEEAGYTLRRAGYDPSSFTVSNSSAVARKMTARKNIAEAQREMWYARAKQEPKTLSDNLRKAYIDLEQSL